MSNHQDKETIIENFDWNQLSLERLKLLQSKITKAIALKISDSKLLASTGNMTPVGNYKASLAKVSPDSLRNSLANYQNCVFIISLGSKNFVDSKRLEASIKWISENFKTCVVLVGDSVYRLTIDIRGGLENNDESIRQSAFHTGQEFLKQNYALFKKYSASCSFKFRLASEIEKKSNFEAYYQEFQSLYRNSKSFQRMVSSFAESYLNRSKQAEEKQVAEVLPRQKQLAITYLLEESALFTCLAQEGCTVFLYPGSIKTFEEISEGLHPEVPLPLRQMIWVSLRLKKKSTASNALCSN